VIESFLGCGEVTLRINDITIKPWGKVVVNLLGWVGVFVLINTSPVMVYDSLGNL
jgi:hypothetical protein